MHERVRSASAARPQRVCSAFAARWAKQDYEACTQPVVCIKEQSYFNLNGIGECTSASAARPQRVSSASAARPQRAGYKRAVIFQFEWHW